MKKLTIKYYMAIDQFGNIFHGLKHPRKDLIEKTGIKHVSKMYLDSADRKTYHVGYILGKQWFSIYEVIPMRKEF